MVVYIITYTRVKNGNNETKVDSRGYKTKQEAIDIIKNIKAMGELEMIDRNGYVWLDRDKDFEGIYTIAEVDIR